MTFREDWLRRYSTCGMKSLRRSTSIAPNLFPQDRWSDCRKSGEGEVKKSNLEDSDGRS